MKHASLRRERVQVRASPFGPVAMVWSLHRAKPRVLRIFLSRPDLPAVRRARAYYPGATRSSCRMMESLADDITAFLEGEDIRFRLNLVRMDLCSELQQAVLRAEHAIPRGRLSTYGRIARHLGIPKAARAVGNCLATNPFPIVIPCHRAIRSDRTMGGYQGGTAMKQALLKMEGIRFDSSGRAIVRGFVY